MVGPMRIWTSFKRHSLPSSTPTSSIKAGSKDDARHDALGKTAEEGPSCDSSPRQPRLSRVRDNYAPEGPSETLIGAMPKRDTPGVSQKLRPESKDTFSSSVKALRISSVLRDRTLSLIETRSRSLEISVATGDMVNAAP